MALTAAMIDTREPDWVRKIDLGVPVIATALSAGDAWLQCDEALVVVERKTLPDLVASIQDGRLFTQAAKMVKVSPWCYLAVMGLPYVGAGGNLLITPGKSTKWRWKDVQGALITLQELGVVTLFRESDTLYADTLKWLAGRSHKDVRSAPRRKAVMLSEAERLLCALPGISETLAKAALMVCGRAVVAITNMCSLLEGSEIPGIGAGKRAAVRRVMGLAPDEQIAILKGQVSIIEIEGKEGQPAGRIVVDGAGGDALVALAQGALRAPEED